ncbi:MAG: hypothetical protein JRE56_08865 [Deltaproteobacteria bacterium]|jgi:uncharacterized Rmd1/YagE family protein|nr:hypothetical protein [Deltaproteobacteria bacterium]
MTKEITVVRYSYRLVNSEWTPTVDLGALKGFVENLHKDLNSLGITVNYIDESDKELEVKGYADLLNIIRLRSPKDHIGNLCLGHIIGQSDNCDLFEDIRRGVSRIAFAPEMIEPEGSNKVVCHNCGCGC